jgi:mono/diheme cytochrome c family protein
MEEATMSHRWTGVGGSVFVLTLTLAWSLHAHQAGEHSQAPGSASHDRPKASIKITMEELHQHGGVPPGWQFALPDGDPVAGRAVFTKLECYQCHTIQGESFPQPATTAGNAGPELTGMGDHHPVEYFAESILSPNAIIVMGPSYTDADGMSIMPDYRDTMTVAEVLDLVAYLKSLKGEHAHASAMRHEDHTGQDVLLDRIVGDYRIHLVYHEATASGREQSMPSHGSHAHGSHGGGTAQAPSQNHLMAFITDARTAEPVPYLPVTASIPTRKGATRTVKLAPMMGSRGFHYGADVTLPPKAAKITLAVGAATMRVMPAAAGRFAKPLEVSIDWTPEQPASTGASGHAPQLQGHGTHSGARGH